MMVTVPLCLVVGFLLNCCSWELCPNNVCAQQSPKLLGQSYIEVDRFSHITARPDLTLITRDQAVGENGLLSLFVFSHSGSDADIPIACGTFPELTEELLPVSDFLYESKLVEIRPHLLDAQGKWESFRGSFSEFGAAEAGLALANQPSVPVVLYFTVHNKFPEEPSTLLGIAPLFYLYVLTR